MSNTTQKTMKINSLNLYILFVGNIDRGKRLQEIIKSSNLNIRLEIDVRSVGNICANCIPDLVILDGFPESKMARSAFYQLRHYNDVRFISLNASPDAKSYLHVNGLSFIRMINRNPKPKELINTISDMVEMSRPSQLQCPEAVNIDREALERQPLNLPVFAAVTDIEDRRYREAN